MRPHIIIDAPAGASGLLLQGMLARADCILIPVAPSAIDIHATANFIRELLLAGRIRMRNIRLGVVANKVRNSMPTYEPLERFLKSLSLPLLTRLCDSDVYLKAVESGLGLFEMDEGYQNPNASNSGPSPNGWKVRRRNRSGLTEKSSNYQAAHGCLPAWH